MKLSDIKIMAITNRDIESWLDRQPEDEIYTIKEIADKISMSAQAIGKRISNVSDKYRYIVTANLKYYGNPSAIKAMGEYKRSVLEG